MAKQQIEQWARNLSEVGTPIEMRCDRINDIAKKIAVLEEEISKERAALEERVKALWTAKDIRNAKHYTA